METPPPAPVTAEQPLVYRPISLLAIGSVIAAGLFTALVLGAASFALFQGAPIYLPPWFLGLAVLGLVLAVTAGWRIRRSEGTLAGQPLANWGWWLSIISGLGYAAFYGATVLAVTQQADNFLSVEGPDSGFFPLLKQGKINQAFLLTQPPARRATATPNDPQAMAVQFDLAGSKNPKGLLSMFRYNDMVRMIVEAGDQTQFKALGVKEWAYGNKGFTVKRTYRINTPEAELDVLMHVTSTEGDEAGPGRKWFVQFFPTPVKVSLQLTDLGKMTKFYRAWARLAVKAWAEKLNQNQVGSRLQAFFDTCDPATREERSRTGLGFTELRLVSQTLTQLGQAPGAALPLGGSGPLFKWEDYDPLLYLPGFWAFTEGGKGVDLTDWEKLTSDPALRQRVHDQVAESFFGRGPSRAPIGLKGGNEDTYAPYRKKDGKMQIRCDYDMPVGMTSQDPMPKYLAELVITAEAREVSGPEEMETLRASDWRIVSVEVTRLFPMPMSMMKVDPGQRPPPPP